MKGFIFTSSIFEHIISAEKITILKYLYVSLELENVLIFRSKTYILYFKIGSGKNNCKHKVTLPAYGMYQGSTCILPALHAWEK